MMSIARSGVFTWTAPRTLVPVVGRPRRRPRRDRPRGSARSGCAPPRASAASPSKKTISTLSPRRAARAPVRSARAGIEARADACSTAAPPPASAAGRVERAVAADELAPVAGPVGLASAEIGEGDARAKAGAPADCGRTSRRWRDRSRSSRTAPRPRATGRAPIRHRR